MVFYKRKRKYTKKKYPRKYPKRKRKSTVTREVDRMVIRKRAKRRIQRYAQNRVNRNMNSLSHMSKTYSFSSYLERHMVPQDNFFVDDTNQSAVTAGILCGSKNVAAPSYAGQLQVALRCGPGGFFDASIPVSNFRSINSRVDDVMSQWKSFRVKSTTYRFEPVDSGRGHCDTQIPPTGSTENVTTDIDFKNLLAWFVIDNGNRDINTNELVGSDAWQAPQPGPPPTGLLNTGKVFSLGSDTANLTDTSVKRRLVSSNDRKSFTFTIYPPKKESPLYQSKEVLRSLTSNPTDYLRAGAWASCDDWNKMFTGAWSTAAELPNNAAFNGTLGQVAPLSVSCILPTRYDAAGNVLQIPLWRVSVKQLIEFKGLRAT